MTADTNNVYMSIVKKTPMPNPISSSEVIVHR